MLTVALGTIAVLLAAIVLTLFSVRYHMRLWFTAMDNNLRVLSDQHCHAYTEWFLSRRDAYEFTKCIVRGRLVDSCYRCGAELSEDAPVWVDRRDEGKRFCSKECLAASQAVWREWEVKEGALWLVRRRDRMVASNWKRGEPILLNDDRSPELDQQKSVWPAWWEWGDEDHKEADEHRHQYVKGPGPHGDFYMDHI